MIKFSELKKFFIWTFIGSLIAAALAAVVTVLIGEFTEVTMRVFMTLFMVILHSLVSLAFIWDDSRRNTFEKLAFFVNTVFLLVVLSFVTSLFAIWDLIAGETVARIYQTFLIVGFASLHGDILSKASKKENYMDYVIIANYVFIVLVALMLQPIIYLDNPVKTLGEFYFRLLGATAIIDGTLSVLTIIFYKLYMHKHPELANVYGSVPAQSGQPAKKGLSIWIWILIIYLFFQIFIPFTFGLLTGFGNW